MLWVALNPEEQSLTDASGGGTKSAERLQGIEQLYSFAVARKAAQETDIPEPKDRGNTSARWVWLVERGLATPPPLHSVRGGGSMTSVWMKIDPSWILGWKTPAQLGPEYLLQSRAPS